jgi:hypothetical protein
MQPEMNPMTLACQRAAMTPQAFLDYLAERVFSGGVGGHGGTTAAQTSLKWEGKPTVPTSRWGRQSSRLSGSPRPLGTAASGESSGPGLWRSSG